MDNSNELPESLSLQGPTKFEKIRALPWSLGFDITNTFFVQLTFFGSAFVLFLNDLHFDNTQIGFLLGIFPFLGLLSLFIGGKVAEFGNKRSFLISFTARDLFTAGLIFVPVLVQSLWADATLAYVVIVTTGFAVCRAVAMTALLPWQQEYIPNDLRGKYSAYSSILISFSGIIAVTIAGYGIQLPIGLARYSLLFGIGVLFGFLSLLFAARIPGGLPSRRDTRDGKRQIASASPLRDKNYLRYLVCIVLTTLATGSLFGFIPLYMADSVGLEEQRIVFLQTGVLIGSLISSYIWGWLADRYGSKPVALSGLFLTLMLPLGWFLLPRHSAISFPLAIGIALLQGVAGSGWAIGSGRLLFVNLVPSAHKTAYLSQYNAVIGVLGGLSSILAGRLLDRLAGYEGQFLGWPVDSFAVLMAVCFTLLAISLLVLQSIRLELEMGIRQFAGLFLHGNPLAAVDSLIRYHFTQDELHTLAATERLGQAHSPLTVDELLKSLEDPRFTVRYEALISVARHSSDERLTDALIEILESSDPALSVMAAWALGRSGNRRAIPALRQSFITSHYRSVSAHAARALGSLDDQESIPLLIGRISQDADMGIQVACASALGKLKSVASVSDMMDILYRDRYLSTRKELGLALARLVDAENEYIQLYRQLDLDPGVTLAQQLDVLRRSVNRKEGLEEFVAELTQSVDFFARDRLDQGLNCFIDAIEKLPPGFFYSPHAQIVSECRARLKEIGWERVEYLNLLIVVIGEACKLSV